MEQLILYIEYDRWISGVKSSLDTLNFQWTLTYNVNPETPPPPPPPEPEPEPPMEDTRKNIEDLVERGLYKDALEKVKELRAQELLITYAAEREAQLKNWLKIKEETGKKREENHYQEALELMEALILDVPAGRGKSQLLMDLKEIKDEWTKAIEKLLVRIETSEELSEKLQAYDILIKISPPEMAREYALKREKLLKQEKTTKTKVKIVLLSISITVVFSILFFAVILPDIKYTSDVKSVREMLKSDPEKALVLLEELMRKKDRPELRRLYEMINLKIKSNKSDIIIAGAFKYADRGNFEAAFQEFERIKEIFMVEARPQHLISKEKELRQKAKAYYLEKVRMTNDPGEKFIHYNKAAVYSSNDSAVFAEMNKFLNSERSAILSSLLQKARMANQTADCKKAKEIIALCIKVDMANAQVHALRQRIEADCK